MKISYNWLQQFIKTDKTPDELSLILTDIGLEVESVEKVQPILGGLDGLVIGKVLSCEQHPNADRLRITKVDVGAAETLQIVCGAANVAEGQKVVVATVGTTLYPTQGESFSIKASKIRGEDSQGMICAEDEIGLGTSHEGIMVLPEDTVVGTLAKNHFQMEDDYMFEIGLTPNRADAASHLGVARDLAAYLRIPFQLPNVNSFAIDSKSQQIDVKVEDTEACKRYSSVCISGVEVKPSPSWLKDKLAVIGIRSINNIVDATNYVLHELGQPLHAFDADKIKGNQVFVKKCDTDTLFVTLDEVERKLSNQDLMICDAEKPMCLAGVFGGKNSGVSENTVNIFLESAYFDSVSVRKTSKRYALKTDASFRFERGTDPEMTVFALKRAALLIKEIAGGQISSELIDIYPKHVSPFVVPVNYTRINKLIGAAIPHSEIKQIILALGIEIKTEQGEDLVLHVPAYRVDVTRECDITEEVLRIYGYNNIAIPSKINASLGYTMKPSVENTQHAIADMLTANGFLEIWCNSLTKSAYSKNTDQAVEILNPLSSDLNVMRQQLLLPALESVAYNQNRKSSDVKFYEFGKTYHLIEGKYVEKPRLLVLISGATLSEQWNHVSKPSNFYHIKSAVDAVLSRLGLVTYQIEEVKNEDFTYGLRYFRGEKSIVTFGAVTTQDKKKTGVDKDVFYADFDWQLLLNTVKKNKIVNQEVSKYPAVRRDLSMLVDKQTTFEMLKGICFKADKKMVKNIQVFDVYEGDKLPEGKKSYALNFTLQHETQTLTDEQIDVVMQKIMHSLAQNANAEIRK
ncbi:MAG: phenylalanine--tRNA ligase subunit beta [Sphingobacteriaceae bacterium]|nr:phenylalanine--tRNA ligase subunit beta [Sphingobacteriaceae bacterium]